MGLKKKISDVDIKNKIKKYITHNFLVEDGSTLLNDDDSFLEKGIIDSTGVIELISFIEKTFRINVEDEELIPDNLDSLNKIAIFINQKQKK